MLTEQDQRDLDRAYERMVAGDSDWPRDLSPDALRWLLSKLDGELEARARLN